MDFYEIILQQKLAGGEGGEGSSMDFLIVHDNNGTLDKTWEEIYNAFPYVILEQADNAIVSTVSKLLIAWVGTFNGADGLVYSVTFSHWHDNAFYGASYSDGYPMYNNY